MKATIQRVSKAQVIINGQVFNEINKGLVVFLGIANSDNEEIISWFCNKILNLRIFQDDNNKMNLSVIDVNGEILVISNFTLYGEAKKGFRPSYSKAANPEYAVVIYDQFIAYIKSHYSIPVKDGVFGAMMDINLTNSGPVTINIEKENV